MGEEEILSEWWLLAIQEWLWGPEKVKRVHRDGMRPPKIEKMIVSKWLTDFSVRGKEVRIEKVRETQMYIGKWVVSEGDSKVEIEKERLEGGCKKKMEIW